MNTYINQEEKLKHLNYKLMELKGHALETELNTWSRIDLIEWLCWNDRNGVYKDEESLCEFGNTVSKDEAIEIITRQIIQAEKMTNNNAQITENSIESYLHDCRLKMGETIREIREKKKLQPRTISRYHESK